MEYKIVFFVLAVHHKHRLDYVIRLINGTQYLILESRVNQPNGTEMRR